MTERSEMQRADWGRTGRLITGILLVAYSWFMAVAVPVPYITVEPGSATDVLDLISVQGAPRYEASGEFLFLTVSLSQRVTPFGAVLAWLDPDVELVREQLYTGNRSREELTRINLAVMEESKLVAIKVALERLGHEVQTVGGGALITDVLPERPAAAQLRVGDLVVGVDGQPVDLARDVIDAVRAREPGDAITLTVDRDGTERTLTVATVEGDDGEAQIGISLANNFDFQFPFDVDINTGRVGGPSAGLAFSLAVIDELTEGELTGGTVVAVTGTIEPDGSVLPVGGIEQKTVAARQAGATLMLVPDGEAQQAERLAGDMEVRAVATLDDALRALAEVGGNSLALARP